MWNQLVHPFAQSIIMDCTGVKWNKTSLDVHIKGSKNTTKWFYNSGMSTFFVDGLGYHHLVFPSPPICALCPPILWPLSRWAMANTWNSHQLSSKWKKIKRKKAHTHKNRPLSRWAIATIWNPHQAAQYWFSGYFHDVHRSFSECVVGLVGLVGLFGLLGVCESDWLRGSGGPSGSCESWGSCWDSGPDGSGGSDRPSWLFECGVSWGSSGSCESCGPVSLVHLVSLFGLAGLVDLGCQVWLVLGILLLFWSDPKVFSNGNIVLDDPKEFGDPQVSDGLKVISNESMDLDYPKEFDDPKSSMIQREFQLGVRTLIIQKSTMIPPSLMVLLWNT